MNEKGFREVKKNVLNYLKDAGSSQNMLLQYYKLADELSDNEEMSYEEKIQKLEELKKIPLQKSNQHLMQEIQACKTQINQIIQTSALAEREWKKKQDELEKLKNKPEMLLSLLQNFLKSIEKYDYITQTKSNDEFDQKIHELNFLFIGATGAGKTSFINLLDVVEQNKPIKLLRDVCVKICNHLDGYMLLEPNFMDQTKSQTQEARIHCFRIFINKAQYRINVIDTPGLGDCEGIENDEKNLENILKYISDNSSSSCNKLHGIFLFINGTECRLNTQTIYILNKCRVLVPDVFQNHLYCIFTHTVHTSKVNIDKICTDHNYKIPENHRFAFENNLFQLDWKKNPEHIYIVEECYIKTLNTLNKLLQACCVQESIQTSCFKEIYKYKIKFRSKISVLTGELIDKKIKFMDVTKLLHSNIKLTTPMLQNFMSGKKKKNCIKTDYKNTICNVCLNTCHKKCENGKSSNSNGWWSMYHLSYCDALKIGNCTKCQCAVDNDIHYKYKYEEVNIDLRPEEIEMLKKINDLQDDEERQKKLKEMFEDEKDKLTNKIKAIEVKIAGCIRSIQQHVKLCDYYQELEAGKNILKQRHKNITQEISSNKNHEKNQEYEILLDSTEKAIKKFKIMIKAMKSFKNQDQNVQQARLIQHQNCRWYLKHCSKKMILLLGNQSDIIFMQQFQRQNHNF